MTFAYVVDHERFKLAISAPIVKAHQVQAVNDAKSLLDQCQATADRLAIECTYLRQEAAARGYEQGVGDGLKQCAGMLAEVEMNAARYAASLDVKLIALVIEVVRKLAPKIADGLMPEVVNHAIREVKAERFLMVKVHPDNHDSIVGKLAEIRQGYPMIEFFEVVDDPRLDRFDCVLESEAGIVKAGLDVQLAAIENAMMKGRAQMDREVA